MCLHWVALRVLEKLGKRVKKCSELRTCESGMNFVTPDLKTIHETDDEAVDCEWPGVITVNIRRLASPYPNE
jgi:hypothetical protein